MSCPESHFQEVQIIGTEGNGGSLREADLILTDNQGIQYWMNVMTPQRFDAVRAEQLDVGHDASAPRILIIDADVIVPESLTQQLIRRPVADFASHIQKIEGREE